MHHAEALSVAEHLQVQHHRDVFTNGHIITDLVSLLYGPTSAALLRLSWSSLALTMSRKLCWSISKSMVLVRVISPVSACMLNRLLGLMSRL